MALSRDPFSRFFGTDTTIFHDEEIYGKWNPPEIVKNNKNDSRTYVLVVDKSLEGRPDLISDRYYGTTKLDWLIIAFNNARQALNWPRVGEVIRVPHEDIATEELI